MDALARRNPHPRDQFITFDPGPHVYTVNADSGYTSVTTWLHSHFEAFDPDKTASRITERGAQPGSKYYGMTKEEIMASWERNGREASEAGTALHENIERFYNGLPVGTEAREAADYGLFELFQKANAALVPYRTEWMVWDAELRLAGSIDMVFVNGDGSLSIYDWKRCKDIRKTAYGGRYSKTECIEHIPDSNYWHYALQLNVYAALLEKNYGKTVKNMSLVVLHPRQRGPMVLSVPWLRSEVTALFHERGKVLTLA